MNRDKQPNWQETLVKDIMQDGFDVAMGGNPSESEEWNKLWGEKEYDLLVAKYSNLIGEKINQAVLEERERIRETFLDSICNHTGEFINPWLFDASLSHEELTAMLSKIITKLDQALQDEGKGEK